MMEMAGTRKPAGPPRKVKPARIDLDSATVADLNSALDARTLTAARLVEMCLTRIRAYDRQGPSLRAILTLNAKAAEAADRLDAERCAKGCRSPLHGIPVILKDNIDTFDMPTRGGSVLLEGSFPPDDAFVVGKLRAAGAIILAKANMSELGAGASSSLGGQTLNPRDLARTPSGSSGETGAAVAAAYAPLGLGTDTGGSIRYPASYNGVAALKPTHGLLSRDAFIPLALTFDTPGPFARNVHDLAAMLGTMSGVDAADTATLKSEGRHEADYTRFLTSGALEGSRLGIARDFTGVDAEVDWIVEASLAAMREAGATVVEVRFPSWLLKAKGDFYAAIKGPEFGPQMAAYLATLKPAYPKSLGEMVAMARHLTALPAPTVRVPTRASGCSSSAMRQQEHGRLPLYVRSRSRAAPGAPRRRRDHELAEARRYRPSDGAASPRTVVEPDDRQPIPAEIANLTGFPDLVVPAGFTSNRLPVCLSFLGRAFSEPRLLALGYSFGQLTRARRLPALTPLLPDQSIIA